MPKFTADIARRAAASLAVYKSDHCHLCGNSELPRWLVFFRREAFCFASWVLCTACMKSNWIKVTR